MIFEVSITYRTMYFGYGSNLWKAQMIERCPDSEFIGLGILRGWKWIISKRGYATVVRSPKDLVYGLVYKLSRSDEDNLDRAEHVPDWYTKKKMDIELQRSVGEEKSTALWGLVYIDRIVEEGEPLEEYIDRVNKGIEDAVKEGMPEWYVEDYMRKFIPAPKAVEGEVLRHTATDAKPEEWRRTRS